MGATELELAKRRLGAKAPAMERQGSRLELDTPALVLDLDALERNVQAMATWARAQGLGLRPHVKTHKSTIIAGLQIGAGARGLCCATIGEAEVMVGAGFTNVLVTSPLVTVEKISRALTLAAADENFTVVVDNPTNVAQLAAFATSMGRKLNVLVDVDPGMHRTGAADQDTVIALACSIAAAPSLRYLGLQCYAGHVQHLAGGEARQEATLQVHSMLRSLRDELVRLDLAPEVVSGGGTGTHQFDAAADVFTELQVGSYVFMDEQYNQVWSGDGERPPFEVALFVQTSIVSNNHAGYATCDAGLKHFAVDGGRPVVSWGAAHDAFYDYGGDIHGRVTNGADARGFELGQRLEFVVPHCDPTVNLYDAYQCVRRDRLVDTWPVDARGR